MYMIYCDDECIYSDTSESIQTKMISATLTLEDNAAGSLVFTMPVANRGYNLIQRMYSHIVVYKDLEKIWGGRPVMEEYDFYNNKTVTCEGEMAYLNDTYQPINEWHDVTLYQFIEGILTIHNNKCNGNKIYDKVGNGPPDDEYSKKEGMKSTIDGGHDHGYFDPSVVADPGKSDSEVVQADPTWSTRVGSYTGEIIQFEMGTHYEHNLAKGTVKTGQYSYYAHSKVHFANSPLSNYKLSVVAQNSVTASSIGSDDDDPFRGDEEYGEPTFEGGIPIYDWRFLYRKYESETTNRTAWNSLSSGALDGTKDESFKGVEVCVEVRRTDGTYMTSSDVSYINRNPWLVLGYIGSGDFPVNRSIALSAPLKTSGVQTLELSADAPSLESVAEVSRASTYWYEWPIILKNDELLFLDKKKISGGNVSIQTQTYPDDPSSLLLKTSSLPSSNVTVTLYYTDETINVDDFVSRTVTITPSQWIRASQDSSKTYRKFYRALVFYNGEEVKHISVTFNPNTYNIFTENYYWNERTRVGCKILKTYTKPTSSVYPIVEGYRREDPIKASEWEEFDEITSSPVSESGYTYQALIKKRSDELVGDVPDTDQMIYIYEDNTNSLVLLAVDAKPTVTYHLYMTGDRAINITPSMWIKTKRAEEQVLPVFYRCTVNFKGNREYAHDNWETQGETSYETGSHTVTISAHYKPSRYIAIGTNYAVDGKLYSSSPSARDYVIISPSDWSRVSTTNSSPVSFDNVTAYNTYEAVVDASAEEMVTGYTIDNPNGERVYADDYDTGIVLKALHLPKSNITITFSRKGRRVTVKPSDFTRLSTGLETIKHFYRYTINQGSTDPKGNTITSITFFPDWPITYDITSSTITFKTYEKPQTDIYYYYNGDHSITSAQSEIQKLTKANWSEFRETTYTGGVVHEASNQGTAIFSAPAPENTATYSFVNVSGHRDRRIFIGSVTVTDTLDTSYRYTNYKSTLDTLREIVEENGGHMRIRTGDDGHLYLDYLKDYINTNSQTIEFGENLLDYTRNFDLSNLCTVLLPLGAKKDTNDLVGDEIVTHWNRNSFMTSNGKVRIGQNFYVTNRLDVRAKSEWTEYTSSDGKTTQKSEQNYIFYTGEQISGFIMWQFYDQGGNVISTKTASGSDTEKLNDYQISIPTNAYYFCAGAYFGGGYNTDMKCRYKHRNAEDNWSRNSASLGCRGNAIIKSDGATGPPVSDQYVVSNHIPVDPKATYYITSRMDSGYGQYCVYNIENEPLESPKSASSGTGYTDLEKQKVETPAGASYIVVGGIYGKDLDPFVYGDAKAKEDYYDPPDEYVTVEEVNNDSLYVESSELMSKYGWIEKQMTWEECKTPEDLLTMAKKYMSSTQYDEMVLSVKAIDLHLIDREGIEDIKLLDKVRVVSKPHNLDKYFPVTKLEIPFGEPENQTFTLGEETTLETISGTQASSDLEIFKRLSEIPEPSSVLKAAKANATSLINQKTNGYVVINQDEVLIMDTKSIETATRLWRMNVNGIGYSSDGYNGTYGLAFTMDGQIVADRITTGFMHADRIRGGTLTLGGYDNTDGEFYMKNGEGRNFVKMTKDGAEMIVNISQPFGRAIKGSSNSVYYGILDIEKGILYGSLADIRADVTDNNKDDWYEDYSFSFDDVEKRTKYTSINPLLVTQENSNATYGIDIYSADNFDLKLQNATAMENPSSTSETIPELHFSKTEMNWIFDKDSHFIYTKDASNAQYIELKNGKGQTNVKGKESSLSLDYANSNGVVVLQGKKSKIELDANLISSDGAGDKFNGVSLISNDFNCFVNNNNLSHYSGQVPIITSIKDIGNGQIQWTYTNLQISKGFVVGYGTGTDSSGGGFTGGGSSDESFTSGNEFTSGESTITLTEQKVEKSIRVGAWTRNATGNSTSTGTLNVTGWTKKSGSSGSSSKYETVDVTGWTRSGNGGNSGSVTVNGWSTTSSGGGSGSGESGSVSVSGWTHTSSTTDGTTDTKTLSVPSSGWTKISGDDLFSSSVEMGKYYSLSSYQGYTVDSVYSTSSDVDIASWDQAGDGINITVYVPSERGTISGVYVKIKKTTAGTTTYTHKGTATLPSGATFDSINYNGYSGSYTKSGSTYTVTITSSSSSSPSGVKLNYTTSGSSGTTTYTHTGTATIPTGATLDYVDMGSYNGSYKTSGQTVTVTVTSSSSSVPSSIKAYYNTAATSYTFTATYTLPNNTTYTSFIPDGNHTLVGVTGTKTLTITLSSTTDGYPTLARLTYETIGANTGTYYEVNIPYSSINDQGSVGIKYTGSWTIGQDPFSSNDYLRLYTNVSETDHGAPTGVVVTYNKSSGDLLVWYTTSVNLGTMNYDNVRISYSGPWTISQDMFVYDAKTISLHTNQSGTDHGSPENVIVYYKVPSSDSSAVGDGGGGNDDDPFVGDDPVGGGNGDDDPEFISG